jgi:hypothetical protein
MPNAIAGCTCGSNSAGQHFLPCPWAVVEQMKQEAAKVAPSGMPGWVCPVCGGGMSPFASRCPCTPAVPPYRTITTTSANPDSTSKLLMEHEG